MPLNTCNEILSWGYWFQAYGSSVYYTSNFSIYLNSFKMHYLKHLKNCGSFVFEVRSKVICYLKMSGPGQVT